MNNPGLREIEEIRKIPMLLIFGKGRSGTTLLQSVLNAHPSVVAPPESKFMMVLYPKFRSIKKWSEKDALSFVEEVFNFPTFNNRWHMDKEVVTSYIMAAREQLDYALACKIIYYIWGEKRTVLYLSDKNPDYYLFTKKLFKLYPEVKFIHLVREPRDNALSTFKAFESKSPFYAAFKWVAVNSIMDKLVKKMPGKGITVFYENMVENPEAFFKNICGFLDIPYVPEMLNRDMPEKFYKDKTVMEAILKKQNKLFTPITPSSVGKWKTDLKPFAIAVTEKITGKYALENYKYTVGSEEGKNVSVSYFKILKGSCIYYGWQAFTRFRYTSFRLNKTYSWLRRKLSGGKLLPWQYY